MKNFTTKRRAASNKVLVDDAERVIEKVNADVEHEITSLEGTKDNRLIPLLDKMRDQTIAYANRNALVVSARFRQSSKSIIALALVVFLICMAFGGLTVSYILHNNGESQQFHQTGQATRFASSYNACLNSNARSVDASKTLNLLFSHHKRPFTTNEVRALVLKYNQEVVPLRSNTGNVFTEPLPNPVPASWKKACAEYAYKEITTVIPASQLPPVVPVPSAPNNPATR